MASLKEIAREYRDEIMDGIAWVAIWKTGRSWNAKAFWLNLETERIEDEEMEEAREIVAAVIVAGEDVCGFAEEYKKQKENRSRYRKVMEELDKRERRRAGRE